MSTEYDTRIIDGYRVVIRRSLSMEFPLPTPGYNSSLSPGVSITVTRPEIEGYFPQNAAVVGGEPYYHTLFSEKFGVTVTRRWDPEGRNMLKQTGVYREEWPDDEAFELQIAPLIGKALARVRRFDARSERATHASA